MDDDTPIRHVRSIGEQLKMPLPSPKRSAEWAPHELAATVNEIIKVVGEHPKYGYKYWLGMVKRSGKGYNEMLGLLKQISDMDAKYPKGATLTNKLSRKKK